MNLCDCIFFAAYVNCDKSGTIVADSCVQCPYKLFDDYWDYDPIDNIYEIYDTLIIDYYYNYDGTYCIGDCSWNSDLEECQMKGIYLMTNRGLIFFFMTFLGVF